MRNYGYNSPQSILDRIDPIWLIVPIACVASALVCWLALVNDPRLILGALYIGIYAPLAWRSPAKAQVLIVAVAPFQQDLGGGSVKFSLTEINLAVYSAVVLARLAIGQRRLITGPVILPVIAYLLVCMLSLFDNFRDISAIVSMAQMALYMIVGVAAFASNTTNPEDHFLGFRALMVVSAVLACVVIFMGSSQSIGLNKNGIGASLGAAFPIGLELCFTERRPNRRVILMGILAIVSVGLFLSLSRGGWLAAILGSAIIVTIRRRLKLLLIIALLVAPFMSIAWSYLPQDSQDYALNFDPSRRNIAARFESIDYAMKQFDSSPLIGLGVGLRKQYDATNVLMMTLAETGILGLGSFLAIHVVATYWFVRSYRAMASSPATRSLIAIAAALLWGRFVHGLVDHYWSRGAISIAWVALGMAAGSVAVERSAQRARRAALRQTQQRAAAMANYQRSVSPA
jgi:O-antigen ligase